MKNSSKKLIQAAVNTVLLINVIQFLKPMVINPVTNFIHVLMNLKIWKTLGIGISIIS